MRLKKQEELHACAHLGEFMAGGKTKKIFNSGKCALKYGFHRGVSIYLSEYYWLPKLSIE